MRGASYVVEGGCAGAWAGADLVEGVGTLFILLMRDCLDGLCI